MQISVDVELLLPVHGVVIFASFLMLVAVNYATTFLDRYRLRRR